MLRIAQDMRVQGAHYVTASTLNIKSLNKNSFLSSVNRRHELL